MLLYSIPAHIIIELHTFTFSPLHGYIISCGLAILGIRLLVLITDYLLYQLSPVSPSLIVMLNVILCRLLE